jgi:site-specific DNA-methyltransferase (adenine-specific)
LKTPLRASPPKPSASRTDEDPDENYTPDKDFAPLHAEFQFTLDPCATVESAKCPKFYTKAQDGLAQSWRGERVWMNPPYSRIAPWLGKAAQEFKTGCPLVVALLPVWSDRKWWHNYIEKDRVKGVCKLRFLEGRICFGVPGNPQGLKRGSGKFPSVLIIWKRPGYVVPDPRQLRLL